jgi:hypothetical protein
MWLRFVSMLLVLMVPFALFAAEKKNEPVGHAVSAGAAIDWQTSVSGHDSITIHVTAPNGEVYTKSVNSGAALSFRAQDMPGRQFIDGSYTYELIVTPRVPANVSRALATARAAGDDVAVRQILRDAGLGSPVTQSGGFLVANGMVVSMDQSEATAHDASTRSITTDGTLLSGGTTPSAAPSGHPGRPAVNDQVIADDLIVQGSTCVGLDCVLNESFGFDTLRLKENNDRIKFEDTSTSAGFPTTDWQLTANDSGSGGLNKFSIEDVTDAKVPFTIEGNAPTNSIYVNSTGRLGIGTSAPGLNLHITTGDTPAIRLEQTNTSGFTAQTWDVAGNEANFFVRDLTGGSRLPFRIRPGATTSSIDISADGDVGINTASPNANAKLDIFDSTQAKARLTLTGQEFFAASNTSTDGIAVLLGVNRTGDRQLWLADSTQLAQNTTNGVLRFRPSSGDISAISTNATALNLTMQTIGGNVGIGTSSPTSKLHVAGDVRVTGGSFIDDGTTLNAPDYVFDASYNLLPIDKVAEFIKNEKHLPNVPSADTIKEQGLNMSQFQMRLLEKVEELTLYTIDQHEQISTLKETNQKLIDRLNALEAQVAKQQ